MYELFFSLSLTLADTNFFTVYCHSQGGDTAAALSDTAFINDIFSQLRATM